MRRYAEPSRRRGAFTVVEMMVVIAIIVVLIGLLLPAISSVRVRADVAKARTEMTQLATGVDTFKSKFGVGYLPSKFTPKAAYAATDADGQYLKQLFPKLNLSATGLTTSAQPLQGDECLVFFLGGIGGLGFSTNPTQPFGAATPGQARIGPFFDFPANRLADVHGTGHQSFIDPWGRPYIYFSTKVMNDYADTYTGPGGTVSPYIESANKFINAHSFQIICAGPNGTFGPGGMWTPGSGQYVRGASGADDLANFSPAQLGTAP